MFFCEWGGKCLGQNCNVLSCEGTQGCSGSRNYSWPHHLKVREKLEFERLQVLSSHKETTNKRIRMITSPLIT